MMETEGRIHKDLAAGMANANEIWVPCEWNRQTFMAGGCTGDIRVMPLGVDEKTYHPSPRSVAFDCGTAGFTFLSVFNWNWRKGPDILLRAYSKAFTASDDVCLVMVSRYVGQTRLSAQIFKDIEEYVGGDTAGRPRLVLVDEVIPTFLMPRLYNSADAFALFTRGEGFLLPAIEAGASGLPVLTSDHGGQKSFLDGEVATLVVPDKVSRVHKSVEWISPFYHGMDFADYSDRAVDEIAEKMRWMSENRSLLAPKAEALRHRILQDFTWRRSAERVAARIREIQ
jgi:glycosyltransferase involved in cell wall biosynthesis